MRKILLITLLHFIILNLTGKQLPKKQGIIIEKIYSQSLKENRNISIYLPPHYHKNKTYPVVFATDGQLIDTEYKNTLDSLINKNVLPEIIIIGSFSKEKKVEGTDFYYRNYEYIKNWGGKSKYNILFDKHFEFFTVELLNYIEKKYSISKDRENRYFWGSSNGAGFGVTMSVLKPNLFSKYICFSMAGGKYKTLESNVKNYPFIDLLYGNKEPFPLTMQIVEFDKYLSKKGYKHSLTVYNGGHDREIWKRLFIERLIKLMNN